MKQKKLVVLGATGSIGDNTIQVVRGNPERLKIIGIAGKKNFEKAEYIINAYIAKIKQSCYTIISERRHKII